jgi:cell division protein FtsZ
MKGGNVAIMNTGFASGENRVTKAIEDALNSPLLNTNDVSGASKILLSLYCSKDNEILMEEVKEIHQFMSKIDDAIDVIWGITFDDTLGDSVKITLIATGFDVSDIPGMPAKEKKKTPELSKVSFTVNDEAVVTKEDIKSEEEKKKEEQIKKAVGEYYGKDKIEQEKEIEPTHDLPVFTLEDLEDEDKREDIENIPAWKRNK